MDTDDKYNCIAWALGKKDDFWWPSKIRPYTWPDGLPREPEGKETVDNFVRAFASQGFSGCCDPDPESGYVKIALYTNHLNVPKHAARLLQNGRWTSKLADFEDIEHDTLGVIEGKACGKARLFFRVPIADFRSQLPTSVI